MHQGKPVSIKCPMCGGVNRTKVVDTRTASPCNRIRRRRQCLHCNKRFSTLEMVISGRSDYTEDLVVVSTTKLRDFLALAVVIKQELNEIGI